MKTEIQIKINMLKLPMQDLEKQKKEMKKYHKISRIENKIMFQCCEELIEEKDVGEILKSYEKKSKRSLTMIQMSGLAKKKKRK